MEENFGYGLLMARDYVGQPIEDLVKQALAAIQRRGGGGTPADVRISLDWPEQEGSNGLPVRRVKDLPAGSVLVWVDLKEDSILPLPVRTDPRLTLPDELDFHGEFDQLSLFSLMEV